jgi:hypothetical protein
VLSRGENLLFLEKKKKTPTQTVKKKKTHMYPMLANTENS